ncbi:MAG: hypothetical protein II837_16705 [Treponema sp.]|nr:hypothetical protein [Treponema sp.]
MTSKDILFSAGRNDECYTPAYAVLSILKYIPERATVWCPFDTEESEFVRRIRKWGAKVIRSHISEDKDFYKYEPDEPWDCIVSNPPFMNKRRIFERVLSFRKPFALIMSNTWLNDSALKQLFMEKDLQLLMFYKRIRFINNGVVADKITFSSSYWCWNFLPKQIVMERLKTKESS